MYIYKITWLKAESRVNCYDSAVVIAPNAATAQLMHPSDNGHGVVRFITEVRTPCWATDPKEVEVQFLGPAMPSYAPGVICASYNAAE